MQTHGVIWRTMQHSADKSCRGGKTLPIAGTRCCSASRASNGLWPTTAALSPDENRHHVRATRVFDGRKHAELHKGIKNEHGAFRARSSANQRVWLWVDAVGIKVKQVTHAVFFGDEILVIDHV
jgi:hypothetical protein